MLKPFETMDWDQNINFFKNDLLGLNKKILFFSFIKVEAERKKRAAVLRSEGNIILRVLFVSSSTINF